MQLYTKILIGLIAGAVVGAVANLAGITILQNIFSEIEILGTAFINLITMIVIPLVVASLLVGTASLGDLKKLGRIGRRGRDDRPGAGECSRPRIRRVGRDAHRTDRAVRG